jgi:DNA-binding XRE family transcriptional regulator
MNDIQKMQRFLLNAFPSARIALDEPLVKNGVWSLNVFLPDFHLAVAWQAKKGFGIVSDDAHGYGEGADEVFEELDRALPRVVRLLTYKAGTVPPRQVRLKELREELGVSQEELGRRLGKKQASVSRTEARSDFHVSTLQDFAHALGAKLVVKMVFSDASERELKLDEELPSRMEHKLETVQ